MKRMFCIWTLKVVLAGLFAAAASHAQQQPASTSAPARDNRKINIHVIGFDVDESTTRQLEAMAQAGGGRYYPAANESQLVSALGTAAGVDLTEATTVEKEGNNELRLANYVSPGAAVQSAINPVGDRDWFAFDVDRQGVLHLSVTQVAPALEIAALVYNAERSAITPWIKPLRPGAETSGVVNLPSPGRYYLQIEDVGNDAAAPEPYTLTLKFEAGDAHEPNGSFGLARTVGASDEFFASILPQGDIDWFAFDVSRRGAINVAATQVPPNVDLLYRVYNAECSLITAWIAPLKAGADNVATVDLPTDGRFYLEFIDANADACAAAEYRVKLDYQSGDDFEPNDSLGTSAPIGLDARIVANILPRGDHDWFVVDVPHRGALNVRIGNSPANQDLCFRVYNRERSLITAWIAPLRAGAENISVVDLPLPGRHYLEICDGKDDERAVDRYSLELIYDRGDAQEPNESWGTAAPIAAGQPVSGSILPRGDHDWYTFEAPDQGEWVVRVTNVPAELDIHVRAWDGNGTAISGWLAPLRPGADTEGTFKVPAGGRYLLEVVDGSDDARAKAPYTLVVQPSGAAAAGRGQQN